MVFNGIWVRLSLESRGSSTTFGQLRRSMFVRAPLFLGEISDIGMMIVVEQPPGL